MNPPMGEIGTIEWCRRTKGILGRGERDPRDRRRVRLAG